MIKYIILITGALVAFFLIAKILKNKMWLAGFKARLLLLGIVSFIGFIVYIYYHVGSNKGMPKNEVVKVIKDLDQEKVSRILIYSYTKSFFYNFKADTVIIDDRLILRQMAQELKKINLYDSTTISLEWELDVKIILKENLLNNVHLKIAKDEKGRCLIWIIKQSFISEFYLGKYRDDDLGVLIERIRNNYAD